MFARQIMTQHVVTTTPDATVGQLADLLSQYNISAVPVVDSAGQLVGIVSETDLMRRSEIGTQLSKSWWLRLFGNEFSAAQNFIKEHGRKVRDIMTTNVISVDPNASLGEVARLLETHSVKRVPVVTNGQLVGIVSRANFVRALATHQHRVELEIDRADESLRKAIEDTLAAEPWSAGTIVNVLVESGVVDLWGFVPNKTVKNAVRVAAEAVRGVKAVNDHLVVRNFDYAV